MHEHSLLNALLRQIQQLSFEQLPLKPERITVQLGALSHISAEHFREHFEQAIAGGPFAALQLDIETSHDIHADNAQDIVLKSIDFIDDDDSG